MSLGIYDIVIIYLATGIPIGVFALSRSRNAFRKNMFAFFAAYILLWPIIASLELVPRAQDQDQPIYFDDGAHFSGEETSNERREFISAIEHLGDRTLRRMALDDFDRLAALSDAIQSESEDRKLNIPEIYAISRHPNPQIASKCLFRRNLSRLDDHNTRALDALTASTARLEL